MNAFSPGFAAGIHRTATPLCCLLGLFSLAAAWSIASHRPAATAFAGAIGLGSLLLIRTGRERLGLSMVIGSIAVLAGLETWLYSPPSTPAALAVVLAIFLSAFLWRPWAGCLFGLAAASLILGRAVVLADPAPSDPAWWRELAESGAPVLPALLLAAGVIATLVSRRMPPPRGLPPAYAGQRPRPSFDLIEGLPHAVAVYDRNSRILATNSAWRILHDSTPDDPSGEHSGTLELHQRRSDSFLRCLHGEVVTDERNVVLHADGRSDWVSTTMSPWYQSGDSVAMGGVVVTKTLLTDQVALEEELTRERAKSVSDHEEGLDLGPEAVLDEYLRVFPDVFFVIDEQGTVLDFRVADDAQGNLAELDLVGTEIGLAFPALYELTWPSRLQDLRESGAVARREFELPGAGPGRSQTFEARIAAVPGGRFVVLTRELPRSASPSPFGVPADRAGTPSVPVAVDLQAALEEALDELAEDIETTRAHVFAGRLPVAAGDRGDLKEVFRHLLANSLRQEGQRSPEIEIEAVSENGLVQIEVADNAPRRYSGLPPAAAVTAAESHSLSTVDPELERCRSLLQRHGGSLWIESSSPDGTRIAFTLHAAREGERE